MNRSRFRFADPIGFPASIRRTAGQHWIRRVITRHEGGIRLVLVACLVLIAIVGGLGYRYFDAAKKGIDQADLITEVASRGPFDHIVLEQGEIESSRNTEIVCNVKSRGQGGVAILWVADEGTLVKEGDKLVELDTSQLELELKEQKIEVITAKAMVSTASAQLEQSNIAKQEYLEGIFKTEERAIQSEIQIAKQDMKRATLALQSSARLVAKGLVKQLQMQADEYAVANAKTQLDSAENRLGVLREWTKRKFLVQYNSEIESAKASLQAADSELSEETNELNEIMDQIANCVMFAPADGVVVHANKFSRRGGDSEFVVEAGATVRERQTIIRLPDPRRMQIKCDINESRITLIKSGMPAKITIDAISGMKLTGVVKKVNRYSEPGSWFSSSVKEYATTIEIIDPPENIRTGMSAEAQIFVEQVDDALQVPIQGLYEHGDQMFTLIQRGKKEFETVLVDLRATNDTMASVAGGIVQGDRIVLNLREHLSLLELPSIVEDDNSDMRAMRYKKQANTQNPVVASPGKRVPSGKKGKSPTSDLGDRKRSEPRQRSHNQTSTVKPSVQSTSKAKAVANGAGKNG